MPDMPISSFIILIVVFMIAALVYIALASMPGENARERGHPHAEAINFLGWVGLLLGIAPWLVAMVWARLQPPQASAAQTSAPTDTSTGSEDEQ